MNQSQAKYKVIAEGRMLDTLPTEREAKAYATAWEFVTGQKATVRPASKEGGAT